ncbi:MAG: polyphosphate kinase 1 [Limisphaerales bacterium]
MDPAHYINRELSWLAFNQRVLDEARDSTNPLLERLKFFCIVSSNLDEFFEVRVAGVKQQIHHQVGDTTPDGRTPEETYKAISRRVKRLLQDQYQCWNDELLPALADKGIKLLDCSNLTPAQLKWVDGYYQSQVHPVLTPLGLDPSHPFPLLLNKSLNIIIELKSHASASGKSGLALVQVPRNLNRLVLIRKTRQQASYVFLEDIILRHAQTLFPGYEVRGQWLFRVTRNSELYLDEESIPDMLKAMEEELDNRRKGEAVRLELTHGCPASIRSRLLSELEIEEEDCHAISGPLSTTQLMQIYDDTHAASLRDVAFVGKTPQLLSRKRSLFDAIRERDHLLHHPFEHFNVVVQFIEQASEDPDVLAIKQTMYRAGNDPRIFKALMNAVRLGKQVTVVMELKARFDEDNNIRAARRLEEAGVHVLYGMAGYKIHCKMCMVVRKDEDGIRRYVHLASGNYNPTTAKLYTDLGLFTARPEIGAEMGNVFNLLTGMCQFQGTNKLMVAPFNLHQRMLALIARETEAARSGQPARIIAKMNALVDKEIIEALYEASRSGVEIDLIIRGVCCLRPGVKGVSERIRVRSIVDRFLEHSRVFYFENGCRPEVYLGSADWMPRNFFKRIEVVFPIEDGILRDRLIEEVLAFNLRDNQKARIMQSDGTYVLPSHEAGQQPFRSQQAFMERASLLARKPETRRAGSPKMQIRTKLAR